MSNRETVLVIAPHPDDETLGCGGALLRHQFENHEVHWLIVTGMSSEAGFSLDRIKQRCQEINQVADCYGFHSVHELNMPPAGLDDIPLGEMITRISHVVGLVEPTQVYVPFRNDVHSDHRMVFDAVMSATKSFRYPFIKRILAYETISETDFDLKPGAAVFRPNYFVAIDDFLARKLDVLSIYQSELGPFPFPRSIEAVEALSKVRGVQCNSRAAEAFMLLKEIV
ncbi:PIG-L deacetylase family protein [Neptuniibacter pectenicola]|uniref:PIG-L deacetylase family protein n=1 Tax=Neptuniibacter pectenicola TaxID=1806669 RepID=UPI000837A172|nr:PIG-L deacetylase family protein [Neptuniibacter pectenicola]